VFDVAQMTPAKPTDRDDLLALVGSSTKRTPLSEQIAKRLISLIGQEGLQAGDELPAEAKLAAAFEVSRPVIREALSHLAALRMVKLTNGKPAKVLPVTADLLEVYYEWAFRQDVKNVVELMELRLGIESICAELAAHRAAEAEIADLRDQAVHMRSALGDMDAYVQLDAQLHLTVVSMAGNTLLQHLAESIRRPLTAVIEAGIRPLMADPPRLDQMQRGHELIAETIGARDPAAAYTAMHNHLEGALRRLQTQAAADIALHGGF